MVGMEDLGTTRPRPWGRVCGLLVACYVTLVGSCVGLDPEVILFRSAAASLGTALIVRTIVDLVPVRTDANS